MAFLKKLLEIDDHLERLRQINGELRRGGRFSRLETDLVKEHLRHLYELYDELGALDRLEGEGSAGPRTAPVPEGKETIPPAVPAPVPQVAAPPEPVAEKVDEPAPVEPAKPEKPERPEPVEVAAPAAPAAAKGQAPATSVSDKLRQGAGAVREVNARTAAAKPLRELIPLNDKFVFIREFFGNSISGYEAALAALESSGSREAALRYLDEHLWPGVDLEKHGETVERFLEIIDSKFSG